MPWTYISEKDGTTMTDIPDNVKLGDDVFLAELAKIRASKAGASAQPEQVQPQAPAFDLNAVPGQMAHNIGVATRGVAQGVGGLAGAFLDFPQELLKSAFPGLKNQANVSQSLSMLLDSLGLPQAQGNAEKVLQAVSGALGGTSATIQAGRSLGQLAGLGGSATADVLASQPIQQGAGAVGSGVGSQVAQDLAQQNGMDATGQALAGLAGGVAGGVPASLSVSGAQRLGSAMTGNKGIPTTPQEAMVADANGNMLPTSAVFPPQGPLSTGIQTVMERTLPFGTGSVWAKTQQSRIDAVKKFFDDYGSPELGQAADEVYSTMKADRKAKFTALSGQKQDIFEKLSEPVGDKPPVVPVDNTIKAIDEQIAKLKATGNPNVKDAIAQLSGWKSAVQNKPINALEDNRSIIGGYFQNSDLPRDISTKAKSAIYGAINEDMGNFIKTKGQPGDFATWKTANGELKAMIDELEAPALKSIITKGGQSNNAVINAIFNTDPKVMQTVYKNMPEDGKAAARAAFVAKAYQDSLDKKGGIPRPDQFLESLQKMAGPYGVYFSGDQRDQVVGLAKYLNATRHATTVAGNPQTGLQGVMPQLAMGSAGGMMGAMGGGASGGALGLAATLAGTSTLGLLSRAYESVPVRNALIALAKAKPGTSEEAMFTKRITQSLSSNGALMQTQNNQGAK